MDEIRFVDKIPFAVEDCYRAFKHTMQMDLYEIVSVLEKHQKYFDIKDSDLVCCLKEKAANINKYECFIFHKNTENISKGIAIDQYTKPILSEVPVIAPDKRYLPLIYRVYKDVYPQSLSKQKGDDFNFLADLNGKTVWLKKGGYEKVDWTNETSAYPVFISVFEDIETTSELLLRLLKYKLEPSFSEFTDVLSEKFVYLSNFADRISVKTDSFDFSVKGIAEIELKSKESEIASYLLNEMGIKDVTTDSIKEFLLSCEKKRCDMDKYPDAILTSVGDDAGLWNFWSDEKDQKFGYPLPEPILARDPRRDIVTDGVIGIDFGTSSTVVVRQTKRGVPIQMSIGQGDKYENPTLMKIFSLENFMNAYKAQRGRPYTEWKDLWVSHAVFNIFAEKSLKEEEVSSILYQIKQWAADNRRTVIKPVYDNDPILLSHLSELLETEEFNPVEIYAYFIGLYINNRQTDHGIFLNYYMSYPASYDKDTRENIRKSFERGLKKSIPDSIFEDGRHQLQVHMDVSEPEAYAACALLGFSFQPSDGEKINYAIFDFGGGTSDFAYGYFRKPNAEEEDNFQFVIENKMTDGDRYLGGENLLEGLSFEVFSAEENLQQLKKIRQDQGYKCCFYYGTRDQESRGVPPEYLSQQQPAKKNMREMSEELRKYWENEDEYFSEYLNDGKKSYSTKDIEGTINRLKEKIQFANLTEVESELDKILAGINEGYETPANAMLKIDRIKKSHQADLPEDDEDPDIINFALTLSSENIKEGESQHGTPEVPFSYSKKKIYDYFTSQIKRGVESFFSQLENTFFAHKEEPQNSEIRVNIFLAGNSSRSPILRKVMNEKISEFKKDVWDKYQIQSRINIYSPLGSEAMYEEKQTVLAEYGVPENNVPEIIETYRRQNQRLTGKTGVAFGLIKLVEGDIKIERENDDVDKFIYYLGWDDYKFGIQMFKPFDFPGAKVRGKPELGKWYRIRKATRERQSYSLRYTLDPQCLNKLEAEYTELKILSFPHVVNGEWIWIKAVGAKKIEYALAETEDQANEISKMNPQYIIFE